MTYTAIGRIAVSAGDLQYTAAYCAALGLGKDDEWVRETLAKPGAQVQKALRELAEHIGDSDAKLQDCVTEYADDIDAALGERNRVLHSISTFVSDGENIEEIAWHPRTDLEAPIDHSRLRHIDEHLGALAGRGGAVLSHEIYTWRRLRDRSDSAETQGSSS